MNLGQFRELTKDLPDKTKLFKEGYDHCLVTVEAETELVVREQDGEYSYWYSDGDCPVLGIIKGVIIE